MPSAAAAAATPSSMYPALFIHHGGGPLPLLGDVGHVPMVTKWREHIKDIVARHGLPSAIAVVSAHYETDEPEVGGGARPEMLYDYYNFPPKSYELQYPAPGAPELAARMVESLQRAGLSATLNPRRKYDHGVFVPLTVMFEAAAIPVVPVSVLRSNDPLEHIKFGQALRPFREEGVFFLGSGASMHNSKRPRPLGAGTRFGDVVTAVLEDPNLSEAQRRAKMADVKSFDGFSEAQPPVAHEHLMPLLTLVGVADGTPAREVASFPFYDTNIRHYLFEN
ncbi:Catalytic LigB subunit of aromatic ring-opening dioxygenase [Novymonas esmeraldas]|uniref:Catalytic LigB subunit of aromatic ring-opening dioxygenase n=1 Tax=Novymonas esmeraldas TaxID=1808958 RepID=A0AAW0F3R8_9TRYP